MPRIYLSTPARSVGIIYDNESGAVKRIINPDFEEELDHHFVGADEHMLRFRKDDYGIGRTPNSMTLGQVKSLIDNLS